MSIKHPEVLSGLTMAASVMGTTMGDEALEYIERELQEYSPVESLQAIRRCMREVKHKLTLADILERLPNQHPKAEEAWGICKDSIVSEAVTVVRTSLMAEACGAAWPLADDLVAARMAFKEKYQSLVDQAKARNEPPKWEASLGHDKAQREGPLLRAVQEGKLLPTYAQKLLPEVTIPDRQALTLVGKLAEMKAIP